MLSRALFEGGRSFRDRVASVLLLCGHHYENPEQFYNAYSCLLEPLKPEDYFFNGESSSGKLPVQSDDGKCRLGHKERWLPVTVEETVAHYLDDFKARLDGIPEHDWKTPKLQDTIQSTLDDIKPHDKMIESETKLKQLDFHLFLRWALMAGWSGPKNPVAMEILGKDISLQRLTIASKVVPSKSEDS